MPKPACVLKCETHADCSALGADGWCSLGVCKLPRPTPDGGSLTCQDREELIRAQYDAIVAAADTAANKECAIDADCVTMPSASCGGFCTPTVLSKSGATSATTALASLEQDLCVPFFDAKCTTPPYTCPFIDARCVAGTCRDATGSRSDGGSLTCDERIQRMSDVIREVTDRADKACDTDANCTTVALDVPCYHACESDPVSEAGAAELAVALGNVASHCVDFDNAGCPSFVPPCVPPRPLKCVANRCGYDAQP
jgi:hypothetical protein